MTNRPLTVDDLYRFAIPGDPDLSPDGDRIAYTVTTQDAEKDRAVSVLWEVHSSGGAPRRLTSGPADSAPRWSPDGSRLAFLRGGQLNLLPAEAGEAVPLTTGQSLPGGAGAPVWSPDGTRIAFAAPVGRSDPAAPIVVDKLVWKSDGTGLNGALRSHLFVVAVASGEVRQLTHGDFQAGPPSWSPDGSQLAFPASIDPGTDVSGASAAYVIDVDTLPDTHTGASPEPDPDAVSPVPRRIGSATGLTARVGWFPDGTALLVVGRTTVGVGHLHLLRQPLDGSAPEPLTAALDRNVMPGGSGYPGALPQFHGEDIVFCARDRGATRLYRLSAAGIAPIPMAAGAGVGGCSVAAKAGRAALLVSDPASFGEIAVLDLDVDACSLTGVPEPLTWYMAESLPDIDLFPVTEREFTVADGTAVHGMVTRDPRAPAGGPLLVDVHGGPHNAWAPYANPVHLYHQELAAQGWTVLTLNIRASDGYGEAFYTAAVGAWGEADGRDVLEPVATLVAEGLVDPERIALTGYSYGGFLACWLSARSDVFAAVVPGGVVTDLVSMAGTSDMGEDLVAQEIGDRERMTALSPLSHVDGVRSPTLILHGGADDRCPAGQAEQWFHALRTRGVTTQLVLYPGGSHLFLLNGRPSHRVDYSRRLVGWVTEHTTRQQ